jgi:enoyl-CoA hydratase
VIAAVQGAAVGLGATIMTMCDIVVAHRRAALSDPRVTAGKVASVGGVIGGLSLSAQTARKAIFSDRG